MDVQELQVAVTAAIRVAFSILAERWLTLLALLLTAGMYAWAMIQGSWLHFAIAGAFGVTVFLPVLLGGRSKRSPHEPRTEA